MAASRRLPVHLGRTLGPGAAEELMTILDQIRADRAESMREITEFRLEFAEFRDEMRTELTTIRVEIAGVKSDLMKWSFVFWCGAVAAIAALAGVLRT